jgi:hypothetical protein
VEVVQVLLEVTLAAKPDRAAIQITHWTLVLFVGRSD